MNLEEALEELASRALWFSLRPHYGAGAVRDGWAVTMHDLNNNFQLVHMAVEATPGAAVEAALAHAPARKSPTNKFRKVKQ